MGSALQGPRAFKHCAEWGWVLRLQAWCIMREISSLIYNASEDQIIRARNQLKASILFSQDGPGGARPLLIVLLDAAHCVGQRFAESA